MSSHVDDAIRRVAIAGMRWDPRYGDIAQELADASSLAPLLRVPRRHEKK